MSSPQRPRAGSGDGDHARAMEFGGQNMIADERRGLDELLATAEPSGTAAPSMSSGSHMPERGQ